MKSHTLRYLPQTAFQERIVHTMLTTIILLSVVYALILLSLVFSVIERKQNILATKDLSSEMSILESDYANIVQNINDNTLLTRHFTRVENATFTVRKDPIASFSVLYTR
jgi:hypothetical protein